MSAEIFVDTNLLYYAHTTSSDPRHDKARAPIQTLWSAPGKAAISIQVLQELHVNLVRKAGLAPSESARLVNNYLAWAVVDNDRVLLSSAFDVQGRWGLSFWDSLIVAAAHRIGASELWSEDLASGQSYDKTRVMNPLR